ncbi:MAG: YHS domain-containing protein, partial [Deltaproteobacteria bacterium]|nr:YHS domain-containing protein [Deltaproteobacteria bacterium]
MGGRHAPIPNEDDPKRAAEKTQWKDPVCGMTVGPESPHRLVYEGDEYRFCAAHCLEKFRQSPERYLEDAAQKKGPAEEAPSPAEGKAYTCPMHPEIVRDAPGSCPKCGMALEARTAASEEE